MLEFQLFPFLISLILTVGYNSTIIQDVNLVNILLRSWKVSLSEIIVCSETRVQWESLISRLLFWAILFLHKALFKRLLNSSCCILHHYSYITHRSWRDVILRNTMSGSSEILLLWRYLCSGRRWKCEPLIIWSVFSTQVVWFNPESYCTTLFLKMHCCV